MLTQRQIISFGHNAGRIIDNWGLRDKSVGKRTALLVLIFSRFWAVCTHHEVVRTHAQPSPARSDRLAQLHLHNYQGKKLASQSLPHTAYGGAHAYNGHRGELHRIVYEHALALGVPIRLECTVSAYWETAETAGVVCDGERMEADVVVGADGVRSKARTLVLVSGARCGSRGSRCAGLRR